MKRVRFSLDFPHAKKVLLVGDFTDWEEQPRPMRRTKSGGPFVALISLPQGRHEYKFLVDGEWHADPAADSVPNRFGTHNSVVDVAA